MTKRFTIVILTLLATVSVFSQETGRVPFPEYAGQDAIYNFDTPALSKAPRGYKPLFIEHYGRHGSRYAYSYKFYLDLAQALKNAEEKGLLTERGKALYDDYYSHLEHYMLHMGDLAPEGWRQQQRLGREMYRNFPQVFKAKDAYAYACASSSTRSIMSMAGFCSGLQSALPGLKLLAQQGVATLNATHPRDSKNSLYVQRIDREWPFEEHDNEFMERTVDVRAILSRLFTDVDAALGGKSKQSFLRHTYVLALGMNSLEPENRTDFSGIFTHEDLVKLNTAQCFTVGQEWWVYEGRCAGVTLDIIQDADKRLEAHQPGLCARFGHDHVFLPVLRMMGVNRYSNEPTTAEEVENFYNVDDTPMACNLQMVFYTHRDPSKPVLVKIIVNGKEGKFDIEPEQGPYYSWDKLKVRFAERLARFPVIEQNTNERKAQ